MNLGITLGLVATALCIFACVGVAYIEYKESRSAVEKRIILSAALIYIPMIVFLYGLVYFFDEQVLQFPMLGLAWFAGWRVSRKIKRLRENENEEIPSADPETSQAR